MKFTLDTNVLDFTRGGARPTVRPIEPIQVIDRTAAGALQVEVLGPMIRRRVLEFYMMPKVDFDALITWFTVIANGAENSFSFEDELGDVQEVRIVSDKMEFEEVAPNAFSGSLLLEAV